VDDAQLRADRTGVGCLSAVQQDTAVTCVDWDVFHGWKEGGDQGFAGVVTVQDVDGAQVDRADWTVPTDAAADRALADLGWRRVGAWSWDWFHRRVAPVTAAPIVPAQQLPASAPPSSQGPSPTSGNSSHRPRRDGPAAIAKLRRPGGIPVVNPFRAADSVDSLTRKGCGYLAMHSTQRLASPR